MLDVADPVMVDIVVDAESHSVDEKVAPMMIQRLCLAMMFDGRPVLASDAPNHFVVKDVA